MLGKLNAKTQRRRVARKKKREKNLFYLVFLAPLRPRPFALTFFRPRVISGPCVAGSPWVLQIKLAAMEFSDFRS